MAFVVYKGRHTRGVDADPNLHFEHGVPVDVPDDVAARFVGSNGFQYADDPDELPTLVSKPKKPAEPVDKSEED